MCHAIGSRTDQIADLLFNSDEVATERHDFVVVDDFHHENQVLKLKFPK